jgi:hypothetical protein
MRRLSIGGWLFLLGLVLMSPICYAQPIPSSDLINNARQYDGKTVMYTGEVIGDIMKRGEFAWLNLNDGVNAIGIWVSLSQIKDLAVTGGYKRVGDSIEVTGVFHRACPEHGGDLDIHAQAVRKLASGRQLQERLNIDEIRFAVILLGILGAVWILTLLGKK